MSLGLSNDNGEETAEMNRVILEKRYDPGRGPDGVHFMNVGVWLFVNDEIQFKSTDRDLSEWARGIIDSDNCQEEIFDYLCESINSITVEREEVQYEENRSIDYYCGKYCT